MVKYRLLKFIAQIVRPRGKASFLYFASGFFPKPHILDAGCGNDSSFHIKHIIPASRYTGLDVADYRRSKPDLADSYILVEPELFADRIGDMADSFDVVISAHNLEHCSDRDKTLRNMLRALKKNGLLYIAFPSAKSVRFPSRKGTLNYYDDETHVGSPPDFVKVKRIIQEEKGEIIFAADGYKPPAAWLIGLLLEPFSAARKRVCNSTWNFYGFESVIWARKL
jgi:SAM-dependent methyltransferase